jgi:hypothetical protein
VELNILINQNPWWKDKKEIENDYHIRLYEESSLKWRPKIRSQINLKEAGVYIIRGPRQVGKTTLLKLIIKDIIPKVDDSRRCFYFACDEGGIRDEKELKNLLETYISWARRDISDKLYIFLDEVTYTKNWATGVKVIADRGKLQKITLIATGSSSLELKLGGERLPGRRGIDRGKL